MSLAQGQMLQVRLPGPGPFGFRLAGGRDFNMPLHISKVTPGGKANLAGAQEKDVVLAINGQDTAGLTHMDAQNRIKAAAVGDLTLNLQRGESRVWNPVSRDSSGNFKVSLKAEQQEFMHPGSSTNKAPRVFGAPQHTRPTPVKSPMAAREPGRGTAQVVHNQFNSPAGLYSAENIAETFKGQTEGLIHGALGDDYDGAFQPLRDTGGYSGPPQGGQVASVSTMPAGLRSVKPPASRPAQPSAPRSYESSQTFQPAQPRSYQPTQPSAPRSFQPSQPASRPIQPSQPASRPFQPAQPAVLPICKMCHSEIKGPFVKVKGDSMHEHCFNCQACGCPLRNQGYYTVEGKIYCKKDASAQTQRQSQNYYSPQPQPSQSSYSTQPSQSAYSPKPSQSAYSPQPSQQTFSPQRQNYNTPRAPQSAYSPQPSPARVHMQIAPKQPQKTKADPNLVIAQALQQNPDALTTISGIQPVFQLGHNQPDHTPTPTPDRNQTARAPIPRKQPPSQANRGRPGPPMDKARKTCDGCQQVINGAFVTALDRNWHPDHFVCAHCHENLNNTGFVEHNGKVYCQEHYDKFYAPRCEQCRQPIVGKCVTAMNKTYHPEHFTCTHCRQPISAQGFMIQEGKPYCKKDYDALFTQKCASCSMFIESGDPWLEALGKCYHANCFNCFRCHSSLEGRPFYVAGGRPVCEMHAS